MKNGAEQADMHGRVEEMPKVEVVDNFEWQRDIRLLDFLDNVGVQMRLSSMLSREGVQKRLASPAGMSFTEFTYQLLQGYDFYHLYRTRNCAMQIGGSDQWGNILSGVEMVGKLSDGEVTGMTFPLLTVANGEKMGKSAGNAVWLDGRMTSPFDLYQYFVRLADTDAQRLLPMMTFISDDNVSALNEQKPEQRPLQKALAEEVTAFVHGQAAVKDAIRATRLLFDCYEDVFINPTDRELLSRTLRESQRHLVMSSQDLSVLSILGVLRRLMPDSSNNSLRSLASSGGIYINGQRVGNLHSAASPLMDKSCFVRLGRHTHFLIETTM
ncbi:Tyrosine--tRNA ligase [Paramicrosporidium saccamoebae]|uniref:Tyrosine--tRNA ligase n=1 Tax=Paramicrosporidium saccamoebae TaxID=1246581 RepID=A0A2H9TMC9_9FUNG|nr:Tyrosine--tRNA ligase [Paramicrosporidium saccamoebae]